MPSLGESRYTCDRVATADACRRATAGGSRTCACAGCRNFVAVGPRVFPAAFVELLDSLGIDPTKDAEVYHTARASAGLHIYGGWYHFVGALESTGDFSAVEFGEGFSASLHQAGSPRIETLEGQPVVQLEFHAERIPWVLNEPEPE